MEVGQVEAAIEEDLNENPYFNNQEPCYGYSLVNSSLQFNKFMYTALHKTMLIELALAIKDIGYKVCAIDTSANSVLNALIYLNRVNTDPDTNWVLLTVDNSCCRIMSMLGKKCIDAFEEKISIGEVLSDAENYASVITAIEPVLKNLPSKYLCVVSKTNVISAEVLSNKINYSAPIIYQEANNYLKEALLNISSLVDAEYEKSISLDVIGSAIYSQFNSANMVPAINLFNKTLGEVYTSEQPPSLMNGKIVLSNGFLTFVGIIIAIIVLIILIICLSYFAVEKSKMESDIAYMEESIAGIDQFLEKHKNLSTEVFDEGDEIKQGLSHNKNVYSYYTIVGTEIPQKLWLTHLKLGDKTTIEGQADNIESIYAFFRSIKDYNPSSAISLQDLGLATAGPKNFDSSGSDKIEDILTTLNADFYKFKISDNVVASDIKQKAKKANEDEEEEEEENEEEEEEKEALPELEVIDE